jgi:hypothetical protein
VPSISRAEQASIAAAPMQRGGSKAALKIAPGGSGMGCVSEKWPVLYIMEASAAASGRFQSSSMFHHTNSQLFSSSNSSFMFTMVGKYAENIVSTTRVSHTSFLSTSFCLCNIGGASLRSGRVGDSRGRRDGDWYASPLSRFGC